MNIIFSVLIGISVIIVSSESLENNQNAVIHKMSEQRFTGVRKPYVERRSYQMQDHNWKNRLRSRSSRLRSFYKNDRPRYSRYSVFQPYSETTIQPPPKPIIQKVPTEVVKHNSVRSDQSTHKQRLRALLAPLPRHIVGPVPTFTSQEEEAPEAPATKPPQFSCPVSLERTDRGRNWRAYPDPESARHYYICVENSSPSVSGVRHGCEGGRVFNHQTETCQGSDVKTNPEKKTVKKTETDKHAKNSDDKQGLFVEFIQFLIKIGMFNKNVVMGMLTNKDLFI